MNAQKAVGENAALKVSAELALDEPGQPVLTQFAGLLEQRLQVLADHLLQHRGFGLSTVVARASGRQHTAAALRGARRPAGPSGRAFTPNVRGYCDGWPLFVPDFGSRPRGQHCAPLPSWEMAARLAGAMTDRSAIAWADWTAANQ